MMLGITAVDQRWPGADRAHGPLPALPARRARRDGGRAGRARRRRGPARRRALPSLALVVFGLGFGLVTQVLMVAVQNARRPPRLGTATAATTFFRALGGAVGAAVLGAVFAAHSGTSVGAQVAGRVDPALASAVTDGVQQVFLVAAPIALAGALVVLRLPGAALRTEAPARA